VFTTFVYDGYTHMMAESEVVVLEDALCRHGAEVPACKTPFTPVWVRSTGPRVKSTPSFADGAPGVGVQVQSRSAGQSARYFTFAGAGRGLSVTAGDGRPKATLLAHQFKSFESASAFAQLLFASSPDLEAVFCAPRDTWEFVTQMIGMHFLGRVVMR